MEEKEEKFNFVLNILQSGKPSLLLNDVEQEFEECWGFKNKEFDDWVCNFFTHLENKFNTNTFTVKLKTANKSDMDRLEDSFRNTYGNNKDSDCLEFDGVTDSEKKFRKIKKNYENYFLEKNTGLDVKNIEKIIEKYKEEEKSLKNRLSEIGNNIRAEQNNQKNENDNKLKKLQEEYENSKENVCKFLDDEKNDGIKLINDLQKKCNTLAKIQKKINPKLQDLENKISDYLNSKGIQKINSSFTRSIDLDDIFLKNTLSKKNIIPFGSKEQVNLNSVYKEFENSWEKFIGDIQTQTLDYLKKGLDEKQKQLNNSNQNNNITIKNPISDYETEKEKLESNLQNVREYLKEANAFNENDEKEE